MKHSRQKIGFFVRLVPLFMQSFFIWPISRPYFRFFLHFQVEGMEHLDTLDSKKGAIFVSNHSSELDPLFLPTALPFLSRWMPMFFVSRTREFYVNSGWRKYFYGGLFFKSLGAYPAYKGANDYEHSLRHHIDILEGGQSLYIFPEGKKTKNDTIEHAHGGAAYLALRTGLPVVPIRLRGNIDLSMKEILSRRRRVSLTVGTPFTMQNPAAEGGGGNPTPEQAKDATEKIINAVNSV